MWWANPAQYQTTVQLSVFCDGHPKKCRAAPPQPWMLLNSTIYQVPTANIYHIDLLYDLNSMSPRSDIPCHSSQMVALTSGWTPKPTGKGTVVWRTASSTYTTTQTTNSPRKAHSSENTAVIIAVPVILTILVVTVLLSFYLIRLNRSKRYMVRPLQRSRDDDTTTLTSESADSTHNQEPIQIYISHPSKTQESEMKLAKMMAKFHEVGIACKAAFTNRIYTAERGYRAINRMMETSHYILVCCDEERQAEMDKFEETTQSEETSPFQPFKLEASLIDTEHMKYDFKRLVVVILHGASHHCVPNQFCSTTIYKYPDDFEDILARLQRVEHHQLPPPSRH